MEIISSMIEYAIFYENSEHKGRSTGRSGTTENILKSALNDSQYFWSDPDLTHIKIRILPERGM